jgi:predicted nucleotidyltransferase component of viral defense system
MAPWPSDAQVEQDLVLTRALVEIYSRAAASKALAFRGGTALHKLLLPQPGRYSEDLDFVQFAPGSIGGILDEVRAALDPWLGVPGRKQTSEGATLVYRFETSVLPVQPMRLKIEINTREHGSSLPMRERRLAVGNPWFAGSATVRTYATEELLGTKLRALYQRKKGRDLFDLWQALSLLPVEDAQVVALFGEYLRRTEQRVSRAQFERNLAQKQRMPEFLGDITPLLPTGSGYDVESALALVRRRLIEKLPGRPWRIPGNGKA